MDGLTLKSAFFFRAFLLNSAFPFPQIVTPPQYPTFWRFRDARYCAMGDKQANPKNNVKKQQPLHITEPGCAADLTTAIIFGLTPSPPGYFPAMHLLSAPLTNGPGYLDEEGREV